MLSARSASLILLMSVFRGLTLGQESSVLPFHSIDQFRTPPCDLEFHRAPRTGEPFTVSGPQGVIVGQQQGIVETWILPVKLLSQLTLEADVSGYPVPLDLNSMAHEIEVCPDHTTITYSHISITVRQTMFAPETSPRRTGAVVLFQVDAVRPATLTVRFHPEMREMWPMPSSGIPSAEWVTRGGSGFYILHTDFPNLAGAIALPGATSGIMAPYQERPQEHPLELILHFDPARDRGRAFPLLVAVGQTKESATNAALEETLKQLNADLPSLYQRNRDDYAKREKEFTSIVTPDSALNADLLWAEISIAQLRARTAPVPGQNAGEIGLVAGYYASGDSARPGFGWYFGRDTLYTVYALDSYGDFQLARTALEFLFRRQRSDGKAMHEYSQTAAMTDWASLPYEYAAADATPLLITATFDYVRSSGDVGFLREHRDAIQKAWQFETTHDSDGDGIYDNAQGTGWVESWPGGMPKQEIYLALLDEQASAAMSVMSAMLNDSNTEKQAADRAKKIHATIESEYYRQDTGLYAFSHGVGGSLDTTSTVFPSIAWWNSNHGLEHPDASLHAWASHQFDTDWGLRDVAEDAAVYDPISYHQGSVWPLFTGWAALAEYRSGHPLAGFQATMQNADLTSAQDPGAVTELLSGAFFEPFGRSTSHQLWSSAMVVIPLLRGLFGLEVKATQHIVTVSPHLPAAWDSAEVHQLRVGDSVVNVHYKRAGTEMQVSLQTLSGPPVHLQGGKDSVSILLPLVELSVSHGLPERGSRTGQMKVLSETFERGAIRVELEGLAGSESSLVLRLNSPAVHLRVTGGEIVGNQLRVHFPPGNGYVSQTVALTW